MDYVNIDPTTFAQWKGLDVIDFSEACRRGESEYGQFPVGDWIRRDDSGGVKLRVPESVVSRHIDQRRSNPAQSGQEGQASPEGQLQRLASETTWEDVANNHTTSVSAIGGGTTVASQWSDAIEEHPELGEAIIDLLGFIGPMAMIYAATDEETANRVLKIIGGGTAAGSLIKMVRWYVDHQNRRLDMAERDQRHRNQLENRQEIPPIKPSEIGQPKRSQAEPEGPNPKWERSPEGATATVTLN